MCCSTFPPLSSAGRDESDRHITTQVIQATIHTVQNSHRGTTHAFLSDLVGGSAPHTRAHVDTRTRKETLKSRVLHRRSSSCGTHQEVWGSLYQSLSANTLSEYETSVSQHQHHHHHQPGCEKPRTRLQIINWLLWVWASVLSLTRGWSIITRTWCDTGVGRLLQRPVTASLIKSVLTDEISKTGSECVC